MYAKTAGSSHPSKMTMTVIIEICMAYESVWATSRAAAAAAGRSYVAYTLLEYVVIIDQGSHNQQFFYRDIIMEQESVHRE
jgi:hypothetical protein